MLVQEDKKRFLSEFVHEKAINELLAYSENKFKKLKNKPVLLEKRVWKTYISEVESIGVYPTLQKYFVQFQFPIEKGVSQTEEYRNVTLKGKSKIQKYFLKLDDPNSLELKLYDNFLVGKVPVLTVKNDSDFVKIVQALSHKNEPCPIPSSMGAACITGINNWDRIQRLKQDWLQKGNNVFNWGTYFKEEIINKHHLYKDTIIILSKKPYSGVKHQQLKIANEEIWKENSTTIRLYHELAHLFTLKEYGAMAKNIHDEIIADYVGIINVKSKFQKDWVLAFLGLEEFPNYREGSRLENYLGGQGMSDEAFKGLQNIVYNSINAIDKFERKLGIPLSNLDKKRRIMTLCEVDLISMSSKNGVEELLNTYRKIEV